MASRSVSALKPRPLGERAVNQSAAAGKNGFAPSTKAPAIRSISRGPIGGTRSISASRFESARGVQSKSTAPVSKAAPKEPLPVPQSSSASASSSSAPAPVAAQELAGGLVSVADQIRVLYDSASTILPQYKNDYQQVLKMDITDMEKGKVADNLVSKNTVSLLQTQYRNSKSPAG